MTGHDDDDLLLPEDEDLPTSPLQRPGDRAPAQPQGRPWKVLIVDDDAGVRMASELALRDVRVDGLPLRLLLAANAAEARAMLGEHPDTAVALVDVIMESRSAGLDLVDWIRETLPHRSIRLVIRTGEPGSAPEPSVMADHDLHDYLAKTETTARRLVSCVTGAIRSWRDQEALRRQEAGLGKVLVAVDGLFDADEVPALAAGALQRAIGLVDPPAEAGWLIRWSGPGEASVVAREGAEGSPESCRPSAELLSLRPGEVSVAGDEAWFPFLVGDGPDREPHRWALGVSRPGLTGTELRLLGLFTRALALSLQRHAVWQRSLDTLAHSLAEREVMLREIHHRVKNNLQITGSLLAMKSDLSPQPEVRSALSESSGRVRAMALVHDQLYRGEDLTRVALHELIGTLARPLLAALGQTAEIELELEPVRLSLERSIPMGLLLHELLTNACQHGRRADGALKVVVTLARTEGSATLSVRDQGPGFGAPLAELARSSLGLRMVLSLAQQLRATVTASDEGGARVSLQFPLMREDLGS